MIEPTDDDDDDGDDDDNDGGGGGGGGRDSSVGIAASYWLKVRDRIPWGQDFPCPPSLLYNGNRVFPGGTEAGAWC